MELTGKTIVFLGDSITEGHGTSSPDAVYWRVLENLSGARCLGFGIGGTRIAPNRVPSPDPRHDLYFASRVDDLPPEADVVAVFGGTNDFGHGDAPMGSMASRDGGTFYGALHDLFTRLLEKYPSALIVALTPLHRCGEDDRSFNERGVRRQSDLAGYVDAILEVSAWYGIPVLDLFRTSGIQPNLPVLRKRYMPDGLHPNDAGNRLIARRLLSFLRSL